MAARSPCRTPAPWSLAASSGQHHARVLRSAPAHARPDWPLPTMPAPTPPPTGCNRGRRSRGQPFPQQPAPGCRALGPNLEGQPVSVDQGRQPAKNQQNPISDCKIKTCLLQACYNPVTIALQCVTKLLPILDSQRKDLQDRFTGAQVVVIFEHCANGQAPPGAARNRSNSLPAKETVTARRLWGIVSQRLMRAM